MVYIPVPQLTTSEHEARKKRDCEKKAKQRALTNPADVRLAKLAKQILDSKDGNKGVALEVMRAIQQWQTPILKTPAPFSWAGGKTWLSKRLNQVVQEITSSSAIHSYCEPFAGALGAFRAVAQTLKHKGIQQVTLCDSNSMLVDLYRQINIEAEVSGAGWWHVLNAALKIELEYKKHFEAGKGKEFFFYVRDSHLNDFEGSLWEATTGWEINLVATFFFIQNHCYHGVYSENRNSEVNSSFGNVPPMSPEKIQERIEKLHMLFTHFEMRFIAPDWQLCFLPNHDDQHTLYVVDPPYIQAEQITSAPKKYSASEFGIDAQMKLIQTLGKSRGAWVYSNHDHPLIRQALEAIPSVNIEIHERSNRVSSKSTSQTNAVPELLAWRVSVER